MASEGAERSLLGTFVSLVNSFVVENERIGEGQVFLCSLSCFLGDVST